MSSSDDDHNCPICLESIFQQPASTDDANGNGDGSSNSNNYNIGATVPCGHLYHYDCFGSWQASRSYGAVKCPTCNVKTENFVRLYLDIGSLMGGAQCHLAEEDDISLSSIEEEDDDDENDKKEEDDHDDEEHDDENGTAAKEQDSTNEAENGDVVDLTQSPSRPKRQRNQQSSTTTSQTRNNNNNNNNNNETDSEQRNKIQRLARIAKKFKRQFLQKNVQYKEQYTEKRKISDRVRQVEGELLSVKGGMNKMECDWRLTELRLNESRLSLHRINREWDLLKSQYSTMEKEKSKIGAQLFACRSHYEKELEKARAKSMSEVQQILEEHPKVVEENWVLKQKLQKLNRNNSHASTGINSKDISKALRQMDEQVRSRQNVVSSSSLLSTRKSSNVFGRGLEDQKQQTGRQNNKDSSARHHNNQTTSNHNRVSAIKVNSGQYSSQASRMMKANASSSLSSQKAKRPPQSAIVREMLSSDSSKKRSSLTSLSLSQNKRMKSSSAARRGIFQRKPS